MLNPWADPEWAGVDTGSGNTFDGRASGLAAELPSVTGMFYLGGRLYYTLSGSSSLYWRWSAPTAESSAPYGSRPRRATTSPPSAACSTPATRLRRALVER